MKLDSSKINFSLFDKRRGLILPSKLTEELAEDIGIMVGDGHIGKFIRPASKTVDYVIACSGNAVSDLSYMLNHVKKLKHNLFGLDFQVSFKGKDKTEIRLKINSKGLLEFYTKIIRLPLNKKENIGIPSIIWTDISFVKSCLRGIVDTDFSFDIKKNNYPVLKLKTASKRLVQDCKKAFKLVGLESSIKTGCVEIHSKTKRPFTTNYLYLSGREKVTKYIQEIGFNNPRNLKKINDGPLM
jgi:hypothetical protein